MAVVNGLDLGSIGPQFKEEVFPGVVPGRTVHIDGDFLAYMCAYEKVDGDKSLSEMLHNVEASVDLLRRRAGAEHAVVHLTPAGSSKGGRYEIAIQKEYQGNRHNRDNAPRFLHTLREFMHTDQGAVMHMDVEADDGMSMEQYQAIAEGKRDLCIIASKDKDLRTVPGLHLDWDTGEITDVMGFGSLHLKQAPGKPGKLIGWGNKFFWAQMLMGDSADNVVGVPFVSWQRAHAMNPTKKVGNMLAVLDSPGRFKASVVERANKEYAALTPKKIGPVMAHNLLNPIQTNKDAAKLVSALYREASEVQPFVHWKTGDAARWQDVFMSDATLLWMRRKPSANDFKEWLTEVMSA